MQPFLIFLLHVASCDLLHQCFSCSLYPPMSLFELFKLYSCLSTAQPWPGLDLSTLVVPSVCAFTCVILFFFTSMFFTVFTVQFFPSLLPVPPFNLMVFRFPPTTLQAFLHYVAESLFSSACVSRRWPLLSPPLTIEQQDHPQRTDHQRVKGGQPTWQGGETTAQRRPSTGARKEEGGV